MQIKILKDIENFSAGDVPTLVSWRNNEDRSISIKVSESSEFINLPLGTFRRMYVFEACYTVEVSNLGLPHKLEEQIQCDLEVSNDSHHHYDPEDQFEMYSWTKEVNKYLEDAGVPLDAKILLSFSW